MITIPADAFKAAGKLLKRLPFTRSTLPVFTHVAVHAEPGADTVTLAVATLDGRLETRVPLAGPIDHSASFLLPPEALRTALKADKGSVLSLSLSLAGRGVAKRRTVQLRVTCGGIRVETRHHAEDIDSFPECPLVEGPSALIPARTIEMLGVVASCASTNETRQILNGVHFTPEDGGMLVATDGKRLAGAPATVPPAAGFILPSAAVHILAHPDFMSRSCTVTMSEPKDGDNSDRLVCFQSDQHRLITKTLSGTYPNWKQVVPREMVASLTIAEDRRPAIVAWLRSLRGREGSVTLRRKKRGVLQLTHATNGTVTASAEVPATETGEVPPITLDPGYLATALEIAPVLWLADSMNPVVARRPDGVFCVVMPMRLAEGPPSKTKAAAGSPDHAAA